MLSRKEKGFIGALVIIALSLGGVFAVNHINDLREKERIKQEQEAVNHTYMIGETAVLDNDIEEKTATSTGMYRERYGWSGALEFTVLSAELVNDPDVVSQKLNSGYLPDREWYYDSREHNVVVVYGRLHNVNAEQLKENEHGFKWFFMNFGFTKSSGLPYFDGLDAELRDVYQELYYTTLEKGETKDVTLAIPVDKHADPKDIYMYYGDWDLRHKFHFDLGLS
ncbi:hypothetical protein KPC83_04465 [Collinsella sp. zg1085]|uniref:hypothetical protein n=1 Tax=Collinsella sp. zg1085 TaxID=2844380 RepID=UPI001C0D7500|nr:hypothetical protein [Collinsella sp. zg1085]QWT17105.1 hypothetical protein KPC83_04465 [Collinsella sp. zg1085]